MDTVSIYAKMLQKPMKFISDHKGRLINGAAVATVAITVPWITYKLYKVTHRNKQITHSQTTATTKNASDEQKNKTNASHLPFAPEMQVALLPLNKWPTELIEYVLRTNEFSDHAMAQFVHGNVSISTLSDLNKDTLLMLMRCNASNPNTVHVLSEIYLSKQDDTNVLHPHVNNVDNDHNKRNRSNESPPAHFTECVSYEVTSQPTEINTVLLNDPANAFLDNAKEIFQLFLIPPSSLPTPRQSSVPSSLYNVQHSLPLHESVNYNNNSKMKSVIENKANQKGSLGNDHTSRTESLSHYPRSGSTRINNDIEEQQQQQQHSFHSHHERRAMASRFYDLLHSFHTLSSNEQKKVMLPLARHFTHLLCEPIYITAIDVPSSTSSAVGNMMPNPFELDSVTDHENNSVNVTSQDAIGEKTVKETKSHATQHNDHVNSKAAGLQESILLHAIADELLNTLSDDQAWTISHSSSNAHETRNKLHSLIALWQMCQSHLHKLHNGIKRLPEQLQVSLRTKEHNAAVLLESRLENIEQMEQEEQEEQLNKNKKEEKPIRETDDNTVDDHDDDNEVANSVKLPSSLNAPINASSPLNLFALMGAIRDIYTKLQDPVLLHLPPSTRKVVLHELAEKARHTQSAVKASIQALRASLPLEQQENSHDELNSSQMSTNESLAESLTSLEVASEKIFDVIKQMEMITNAEDAALKEEEKKKKEMQKEKHTVNNNENKENEKKQNSQLTHPNAKNQNTDSEANHKSQDAPRNMIQTNMIIGKYEYILNVLRSSEYINANMQDKLVMTQSIRQLLEELMTEVSKLPEAQQVTLSRALLATSEMLKDFEARLINAQGVHELPSSSSTNTNNNSEAKKIITSSPSAATGLTSVLVNKPKYTITPSSKEVKHPDKTNTQKENVEQNTVEKDKEIEKEEDEEEDEEIEANPIVFAEKMYTTISSDEFTRSTNEEKKTMAEFLLERIRSAQELFQNECPAMMTPEVNSLYTTLNSVLTRMANYSSLFDVLNKQLDWITAQLDSCSTITMSMSGRKEIANMLLDKITQMKQLPLESSLTLKERQQFNEKCEKVTSKINEFTSTQTNIVHDSTSATNTSDATIGKPTLPLQKQEEKEQQQKEENEIVAEITLPEVVLGLQEIMNGIQSSQFILMPVEERRVIVSNWMNRLSLYITYCTSIQNENETEIQHILPLLQLMHARLKSFAEFVPESIPSSTNQENITTSTNKKANESTPSIPANSDPNQAEQMKQSLQQEKQHKDESQTEDIEAALPTNINQSTTSDNNNNLMTAMAQRHALFAAIKEMTNELTESNNRTRTLYSFANSHHLPPSVTQLQPTTETISRLHNLLTLINSFGDLTETEEEIREAFVRALHEMTSFISTREEEKATISTDNNKKIVSESAIQSGKTNNKDLSVKKTNQLEENDDDNMKSRESVSVLNEERVANILLSISDQLRESANVPEELLEEYEQLLNQVARTSTSANIIDSVAAIKEQIKLQRLSNNPTSYESESSPSSSSTNNNEEEEGNNDDEDEDDDDIIVVSADDQNDEENQEEQQNDENTTKEEQMVEGVRGQAGKKESNGENSTKEVKEVVNVE